jgi:hypothetical protein
MIQKTSKSSTIDVVADDVPEELADRWRGCCLPISSKPP